MKSALTKLLPSSKFARSVSILAGGTAASQLIVTAAAPILTRLYTPEDFGLLAVFGGILGILGVLASLRYELAIPLPESDGEAANIALLSTLVVFFITACSVVAVLFFGKKLAVLLKTPTLEPYLWLVPVGLLLSGIYQVFQYWAIRKKAFTGIARTKLSQSIGMVTTQVAGHTFGPIALLVGRLVGQSAGAIGLIKSAFKRSRSDFKNTNFRKAWQVGGKYKNFPLIGTWTGLASSAGLNLTPLLIAAFLGSGAAGLFALAHRVLSQPMSVVGKAVGDAFYQKASEAHRTGELGQAVSDVYSILVKLALGPAITIFIVIPDLFNLVFGESWILAGEVARWMTPWLFFQFIVSPCTGIFPIIDRHGIALRFQLSLLAASLIGTIVGGFYFKDLVWVVALVSGLSSIVYLWRLVMTFRIVNRSGWSSISSIFKAVPVSILINLPVILVALFFMKSNVLLLSSAFMSMLFWFFFLVKAMAKSNYKGT